jgi:hypothetical protein
MVAHIEFAPCAICYGMPDRFRTIAPRPVIVGQGAPENIVQHRRPFRKLNLCHVALHQQATPIALNPRPEASPTGAKQCGESGAYMIFDAGSRGGGIAAGWKRRYNPMLYSSPFSAAIAGAHGSPAYETAAAQREAAQPCDLRRLRRRRLQPCRSCRCLRKRRAGFHNFNLGCKNYHAAAIIST